MSNLSNAFMKALFSKLARPSDYQAALAQIATSNLSPEMLEGEAAQVAFRFILEQGHSLTMYSLQKHLAASNREAQNYINDVMALPLDTTTAFASYCQQLPDEYRKRQALQSLEFIYRQKDNLSLEALTGEISALQQELLLAQLGNSSILITAQQAAAQAEKQVDDWEKGETNALPTGFKCLDKEYRLPRGQMTVVNADTGAAKSAFTMQMMLHNAGLGAVVYNGVFEMEAVEVFLRMGSNVTRINQTDLKGGLASKSDYAAFKRGLRSMSDWPIYWPSSMDVTIRQILVQVQAVQAIAGRIDMIIVDYARLVKVDGKNEQERAENLGRELKLLSLIKNQDGTSPAVVVVWDTQKIGTSLIPSKNSLKFGGEYAAALIMYLLAPYDYRLSHESQVRSLYRDTVGWGEDLIEGTFYESYFKDEVARAAWIDAAQRQRLVFITKHRMGKGGVVIPNLLFDGNFTLWYED